MTPEQEAKFEKIFADLRGRQEALGELVIASRTAAENRDKTLGSGILQISNDQKVSFETLQNLVENVRSELLEEGKAAEARVTERLDELKSHTLNLVQRHSEHAERIDSAISMGIKRAEEMQTFDATVRKALEDLSKGVAATYDRTGTRRPVVDERAEEGSSEPVEENIHQRD